MHRAGSLSGFAELRLFLILVLEQVVLFFEKVAQGFCSAAVNAFCPPIKSTPGAAFFVFILLILKIFINKF